MEDNNGEIIIDVSMDKLIDSLRELKRQYEANAAAMKALKEAGKEDSDEFIELAQANKVLKGEMRGVETQMQNEIKAERAQEGSLVQLRGQLANLNKQYDSMSGFDRLGVQGQALQQRIKGLSDQIIQLEGDTGRWQRNVGNYKSALEGLRGGFQAAGLATGGLDKSLKLLNGNPIMLLLTAIVTVAKQIIQAFKGNEEATMALKEAFSAFNPIIDAGKRALEAFANVIVKVVTGAVNGLTSAIGWLLDRVQDIGEFFGADWHMGDNFRDAQDAARDLAKAENDYIKNKRQWSVESAKIDREVADLREKAADKERYNAKERLAFMDQAIALETRKAAKEKELAEQNLRNLQMEAERSANDAAMNDRLAEAERAVIEADRQLSDTKRSLQRQRQASINEINGETKATKGLTESVRELRHELEMIRMLTIGDAAKEAAKGNRELADSITEAAEMTGALKTQVSELQGLDTHVAVEVSTDVEDAPDKLAELAAAFQRNGKTIQETAAALGSSFGSLSDIYSKMADDETRSEEERAEAARKSAMWAKLQIAANSGTAIAKGVASAMDTPFPANIAAIATTMAAVLSAIAQAKALAAEGYASGGVIGGIKGASLGRDNAIATVREGEMVLNAEQQRRLLEIATGNDVRTDNSAVATVVTEDTRRSLEEGVMAGVTTSIAAQLAAAIARMPAPVLDYSEFTRFTQRVASLNETAKLR